MTSAKGLSHLGHNLRYRWFALLLPLPTGTPSPLPHYSLLKPCLFLGKMAALSCSPMSFLVVVLQLKEITQGPGGHQVPKFRHQAIPAPNGSGLLRSSLGHCGQHLIPTEWFSSLRPAREGSGQLNLPTACLTPWL